MKNILKYILGIIILSVSNVESLADNVRSFAVGEKTFLFDGQPYVIKAAELHYPRIPRPYWEHRIKMCKALGMNTICMYVFWNIHEQNPDEFDFTGNKDIAEFVRLCQKNDLNVILRPGPYVCAEWEMGGLPWWLLKKEDIRLRENDPYFVERVEKFQTAIANELADLTVDKGGPIIMIQVENEYGAYGQDKEYISNIRDILRRNFGNDILMFQCDWNSNFEKNGLDDLLWTLNFGTGANIQNQFATLVKRRPDSPLMCSEFWSGWFDKWGARHETRNPEEMISGIDEMLSKGISFSLYMTHGGTNWGHWAGANSPGYAPDVTSYDYDAPISESGLVTPKYHALRSVLAKYDQAILKTKIPKPIPTIKIREFELKEYAPLFENLPVPKSDRDIHSMEYYNQGFGSILYQTELPAVDEESTLLIEEPHDYVQIFIDGDLIGKLDRRKGENSIRIPANSQPATLDLLVEATGRINFGRAINDYKGITNKVTLSYTKHGNEYTCNLKNWRVYLIPDSLEFYNNLSYRAIDNCGQPGVYRGSFNVDRIGDTFLDFSNWGKGLVYVNGHAIGRIWSIGPQQTLYLPGCWLKKGNNNIVILDIEGPEKCVVSGKQNPIIDHLQSPRTSSVHKTKLNLTDEKCLVSGKFSNGNGWKTISFDNSSKGRYLCLEILDTYDDISVASIAEIYALDNRGNRISRENWKIDYVNSENLVTGNHSADKIFDLQESTYWESASENDTPHYVVIDLGDEYELSGFQYLPRMEANAPGAIRNFRIFLKKDQFNY